MVVTAINARIDQLLNYHHFSQWAKCEVFFCPMKHDTPLAVLYLEYIESNVIHDTG